MGSALEELRQKRGNLNVGTQPSEVDPTELPTEQAQEPEAPLSALDSLRSKRGVTLPKREIPKEDPVIIPVAPEESSAYEKVVDWVSRSVVEQLAGGYHDWRQRAAEKAIVSDVEALEKTQEGQIRTELGMGPLGVSFAQMRKEEKMATPEGEKEVLDAQYAEDVASLAKHMQTAKKHEKAAGIAPFSPETLEFMDENSDLSIGEAFAKAPGKIITELGLRSFVSSAESIGTGIAGGVVGSAGGPLGSAAGFGAGMAVGSARIEYAASLVEAFKENGADFQDPDSIMKLVSDKEFMQKAQKYALARASIIGGIDGISGLVGAKHFTPGIKNSIARELANAGIQMPVQAGLGAAGELGAQVATKEEGEDINWREVAAEAAGELVTAPVEVAGAAVSGARKSAEERAKASIDNEAGVLQELEARQNSAREEALAAGGDNLDAELAASQAAASVTAAYAGQVEAGRRVQEETTAATEEQQIEVEEQAARDTAFEEAEQAAQSVGLARVRQARQAEIKEADIEATEREAAFAEREFQEEIRKGEEIAARGEREKIVEEVSKEAKAPTLGEVSPELQQLKEKLTPKKEVPVAPEPESKVLRLEDKKPVTVTPEGEAVTPKQADAVKATEIDKAAQEAATSVENVLPEPTEAQKKAGNYKKGHTVVQGLDISIENPVGSTRTFTRDDGSKGEQVMGDHYGYIKRTTAADGDQIDVFLGNNPESDTVYVMDQINQETGQFDEHKVMMGYPNQLAATRGYRRNYEKGFKPGKITPMTVPEFKAWLKEGSTTSPLQPIKAPRSAPAVATETEITAIEEAAARRAPRRKVRYREGGALTGVREQRGQPVTEKMATRAVEKLNKTTPGVGNAVAVSSANLPSDLKERVTADGRTDAKGVYDPGRDAVYVFADNHFSEEDVQRTVLHETVAHKGLRSLFPDPEEFNNVMQDVYENADQAGIARAAEEHGLDIGVPGDQSIAAEEYIASIAESDIDPNILQRVIDAVRKVLRKAGVVRDWSDNDIRALLRDSRSGMKGKPLGEVVVVSDAEIAETRERVELEEPADVAIRQAQKRIGVVEQLRGCMG